MSKHKLCSFDVYEGDESDTMKNGNPETNTTNEAVVRVSFVCLVCYLVVIEE